MSQIQKKFIANNAIDETKLRLSNNGSLKARNAANSADINILKINASDALILQQNLIPENPLSITLGSVASSFGTIYTNAINSDQSKAFTGNIDADTVTVTVADTTGIVAGQNISGVAIDPGTTVASVNSATQFTLSNAALTSPTTGSVLFTFSGLFLRTLNVTGSATDYRGSGTAQLRSGNVAGAGNASPSGQTNIFSGSATDGGSGKVQVKSGNVSGSVGVSGAVDVLTGNSGAAGSGAINLTTGTASGGTRGNLTASANLITLNPVTNVDLSSKQIKNLANGSSAQDAVTLTQMQTADGLSATKALDNLASTAVNAAINPASDNTLDFGTNSLRWKDMYARRLKGASTDALDVTGGISLQLSGGTGKVLLVTDLEPTTDLARHLGSSSFRFSKVWTRDVDTNGASFRIFSTSIDANSVQITNVADPTTAQHAATKAYVDAVAQGLKPKAAVRVASTANVAIATELENGDTIDGVTLATGNRVLLKDQSTASQNGIYIVAASGAASRASDFDSISPIDEINGAYTFVQEGTANAAKAFVQTGVVATLGTDPVNFVFFNSAGTLVGHDMITISGNNVSVDLATSSGLESSSPGNAAGQLRIKLEASNPSLKFSGSNELGAKLDAAGAITSGASGLIVGVDNSTVEISSNALRVKDLGITSAKLAANSVIGDKVLMSRYTITLSGTDITNQYVDITASQKLKIESAILQPRGGMVQEYGRDYDLDNTGSQSRIRFDSTNLPNSDLATGGAAALIAGDVLLVQGIRNV